MMSERLLAIASFLNLFDSFIDIGCDHAYLSIFMAKKGCKHILATDIHENALEVACKNIKRERLEKVIETKLADGLHSIDTFSYNTLVIAGMGTNTIEHILSLKEKLQSIQKIILQSNKEVPRLRKFMMNLGYTLIEEKVIKEKNHYYIILHYQKGKQSLREEELELGFYKKENIEYYLYLQNYYKKILLEVKKESWEEKELLRRVTLLNLYLQKKDGI